MREQTNRRIATEELITVRRNSVLAKYFLNFSIKYFERGPTWQAKLYQLQTTNAYTQNIICITPKLCW